jgi:hypothetical protein
MTRLECASATVVDPIASPPDNACKTSPKIRAESFPETETFDPSPLTVRVVAGALINKDPSKSFSSASSSDSMVDGGRETGMRGCAPGRSCSVMSMNVNPTRREIAIVVVGKSACPEEPPRS